MIFTQYYLECLSHASYLIGDTTSGTAVVVDPQRDIDGYLADAAANDLTIVAVIETHFHADFLSGHLELADATGAEICYGPGAETEFPSRSLTDGEEILLGDVKLRILHTPGHTPESISIVVFEHADDTVPYGVLTGDTLFIGDVGRPDLLAAIGVTAEELASMLYDSLHTKLLTLPDETRVFPAHGAGSACGKNLSTETQSTIGVQRVTNYALAPMTREEFMDQVTEGQPSAPGYFVYNAVLNRKERELLDTEEASDALGLDDVLARRDAGALVLDTRSNTDFAAGHLKGAVNVGLDGRFAEYVGSVVPPSTPIVLVSEAGTEAEAKMRLGRIGYDDVVGHLAEPELAFLANPDVVEPASRLTAAALAERRAEVGDALQVVDIRNPGETALGMLPDARPIPLAQLRDRVGELDPAAPTLVYCAGGYRSSAGASLLRSFGFTDVSDLHGGYGAWQTLVNAGTADAAAD